MPIISLRRFLPMARITVEDCLSKIGDDNRFSLVHLTVERVKQRRQGAPLLIPAKKNKEVVMALREIAAGKVDFENILDLPKLEDELGASDAETDHEEGKQAEVEAA
jgi:DNA-directed RNA polymerase subunit omega